MAVRYSGQVEIRMTFDGQEDWSEGFYHAAIHCPEHHGRAILSLREVGFGASPLGLFRRMQAGDPQSSEAYDRASLAFLELADKKTDGVVGEFAERDEDGEFAILRIARAPCPGQDLR